MLDNNDNIAAITLQNVFNYPVTIISGEFPDINKRVLPPRSMCHLHFYIPYHLEFFVKEELIFNKRYLYVGLVSQDYFDGFVLHPI